MSDPVYPTDIQEQERRRLSRLLEKRLSPSLNLLLEQANAYRAAITSAPQARQASRTLAEMAARTLTALHDLLADLRPPDLETLSFGAALEALALRFERQYGLSTTLDLDTHALPHPVTLPAYRITQEALHNVAQHAGAGRVGISLRIAGNHLQLTIADDGTGFQPPEPLNSLALQEKWGLAEMEQQATSVGGRVEIRSIRGVGTQVQAVLPLEPAPLAPTPSGSTRPLVEPLTPREQEVLAGVTAGLTNKQIAAQLSISDRTVQFHLGNVLGKLGVASRTEAAVRALQQGLVPAPPQED